jgi:gamma-glutamyltranspeptidase/glutathione hydrolase
MAIRGKRRVRHALICIIGGGLLSFMLAVPVHCETPLKPENQPAAGKSGMVASAHRLASEAGVEILKRGGNAVDAAVAAAFAVGVVEPYASGIGGGGFMLIYTSDSGKVAAVDYRETAPGKTPRGKGKPPATGGKSIAVPGTVAGLSAALSSHGTMTLKEVLEPAIRLAEGGFVLSRIFIRFLSAYSGKISQFPALNAFYLKPGYREGDRFYQKDLARTYRSIAEKGSDFFYRGELSEAIIAAVKRSGGRLSRQDLAGYRAIAREPVKGRYRNHDIYSMPPPSSGGVHVIGLLNIMSGFDVAALGGHSAAFIQLTAEAMRRVFRDRERYMGDPDFVRVPVENLISPAHAEQLTKGIKKGRINPNFKMPALSESEHTTHISVVDNHGNMVALTQTLNSFFGSGILVPATGILLNNEMADFAAEGPNAPEPGKKPVSNLSPTIVLRDGKPFLSLGMAGATRIIAGLPQIIMNAVDFGMNIQEAVNAPRFYCRSETISMEARIPKHTRNALAAMGYGIKVRKPLDIYFGGAQAVMIDPQSGIRYGAADPRRKGAAAGY